MVGREGLLTELGWWMMRFPICAGAIQVLVHQTGREHITIADHWEA